MPRYDYVCKECGDEHEETHGMTASPEVKCWKCGSANTFKAIRACGIITRNSGAQRRFADAQRSESEQRQDLKENYGVENVTPLAAKNVGEVYNEVKAQGTRVKDMMQRRRETNQKAVKEKQRKWAVGSNKRVAERTRIANEKKAEAAQKKRAISL
jgi:putative FmdB family regulatory protein